MTVTREDLERHLDKLRAKVGDPRAGLYGPGPISWEVNREAVIMLGGGAAALLQLAHPFVAHAVDQHSQTRADPLGRFRRTFENVFAMVFGELARALASARRVHDVHTRIRGRIKENVGRFARGDRYEANDEQALLWVHATLVETSIRVFEPVVRRLTAEEKDRFYEESKLFAYLFGIPDSVLPPDWRGFSEWYEATIASDVIAVGGPALEMRRFLLQPPTKLHEPFVGWLEVFTAGLLPPKLRSQFDFRWTWREEMLFQQSLPLLRASRRALPARLRYFPAYVEARRRLAGRREHDRVGRLLEKVALRSLEPRRGAPATP